MPHTAHFPIKVVSLVGEWCSSLPRAPKQTSVRLVSRATPRDNLRGQERWHRYLINSRDCMEIPPLLPSIAGPTQTLGRLCKIALLD